MQMSSNPSMVDLTGHATRQATRNAFGLPSEQDDRSDAASRAHLTMAATSTSDIAVVSQPDPTVRAYNAAVAAIRLPKLPSSNTAKVKNSLQRASQESWNWSQVSYVYLPAKTLTFVERQQPSDTCHSI